MVCLVILDIFRMGHSNILGMDLCMSARERNAMDLNLKMEDSRYLCLWLLSLIFSKFFKCDFILIFHG